MSQAEVERFYQEWLGLGRLLGIRDGDLPSTWDGFLRYFDEVIANKHIQVLIPPDRGGRSEPRPGWTGGRYSWMRTVLDSPNGKALYRRRIQMIEPVFAHTKHNRLITRFHRKGRVAVRTEWRLLMATHNLTKLHSHQIATVRA